MIKLVTIIAVVLALLLFPAVRNERSTVTLTADLEDRTDQGSRFTPTTQSMVRGHHWLTRHKAATLKYRSNKAIDISLGDEIALTNLPFNYLLPRLNYTPATIPDAFDALNLRLAEYSRNGVSVPVGDTNARIAHFKTSLEEATPWQLTGDYQFSPNPKARPLRVGVTNNCLFPGLWEISAFDRSGEMYHSWFEFPKDRYLSSVAEANQLTEEFTEQALAWNTDEAPLKLDRLRRVKSQFPTTGFSRLTGLPIGYSTQDSRRKIQQGFVEVKTGDQWKAPKSLDDLTSTICRFPDFVPPGKYSYSERKEFDLSFLAKTGQVNLSIVEPLTKFEAQKVNHSNYTFLEMDLELDGYSIILGNLPLELIVPQEDYPVWGFGVGILPASDFAERRKLLVEQSPPPAYAYLCKKEDGEYIGINSHALGLEQVFLRAHADADEPWWEITVASFERIVDLAKYRVPVPRQLHKPLREAAYEYVSPLYRTYRDDNIR